MRRRMRWGRSLCSRTTIVDGWMRCAADSSCGEGIACECSEIWVVSWVVRMQLAVLSYSDASGWGCVRSVLMAGQERVGTA